jgi:GT2 family glycosyltransferase
MALRAETLAQVGSFDERYFMYLEDYDLIRRVGTVSRTVYLAEATIYHEHQKESFRSWKMTWVHIRSAVAYFNKWGWWRDPARRRTNKEALHRLRLHSVVPGE